MNNQARFIQMIVDRQLIVSNRKKVDIVADLRKLYFRPFPKIAKAKEAGEDEPTLEQEEEEEEDSDDDKNAYDYLLNMAIHSLTREKVRVTLLLYWARRLTNIVDREAAQAESGQGG